MADQEKNIDDLFRDKLGDYTEQPGENAWSDVEQKLDNKGTDSGHSGTSGINPAGIVMLVVVGIALFFTAKWAIGHLGKNRSENKNAITIVNENKPNENNTAANTTTITQPGDKNQPASATKTTETTAETTTENTIIKTAGSKTDQQTATSKKAENSISSSANNSDANKSQPVTKHKSSTAPRNFIARVRDILPLKKKDEVVEASKINNNTSVTLKSTNTVNTEASAPAPVPAPVVPNTTIVTKKDVVAADNTNITKLTPGRLKSVPVTPPAPPAIAAPPIPPVPVLSAQAPEISEKTETIKDQPENIVATPDQPVKQIIKANDTALVTAAPIDIPKIIKGKHGQASLQGGIKLGFEGGFADYTVAKIIFSPYLQYNLGNGLSVLTQPALKFNSLNNSTFSQSQSYNTITNSSVMSAHITNKGADSSSPDTIIRRYYYTQSHDSVDVSYRAAKKRFVEFELPVLLQYKLSKQWAVYGGVNFNFSKVLSVEENKTEFKNIVLHDSVIYGPVPAKTPEPTPPTVSEKFKTNTSAVSNGISPAYINPDNNPIRLGYTVGVSYSPRARITIDLLMQQMLSNAAYIPNKDVRTIYTQPYFRLSVGYRFFKIGK